jgi:peptidyl-prolyl cis-trans isomerase C
LDGINFMRIIVGVFLIFVGTAASAGTVATVDGHSISEDMVFSANPQAKKNTKLFEDTLNILVDRQVLANAAVSEGLVDKKQLNAELAVQKQALEAKIAAEHYLSDHPVSESDLEKYYGQYVSSLPKREYRYRYIVVENYDNAEKILKELSKGAFFTQLAATYSTSQNAALGGETGWVPESSVPAPFLKYVREDKDLTIYGPIAVPQGYAILQTLSSRATPVPNIEAVSQEIKQRIDNQLLDEYVKKLKSKSKISLTRVRDTINEAAQ